MEESLTKDAEYMLCVLYKEYIDRIKAGVPKDDAIFFGGAEKLQDPLFPMWPTHDISATARELKESGYLSALFGDNSLIDSALTKNAVIYMENRFKKNASGLLHTISKLAAIVFP